MAEGDDRAEDARRLEERNDSPAVIQERAAATRAALIAAARRSFGEVGYHATATSEVVASAAVTRGALYYHFGEKKDLFEAVFREVWDEVYNRVEQEVAPIRGDPWRRLLRALEGSLREVAVDVEIQRILLIDGPAVLGWQRWRELRSTAVRSGLAGALQQLMDEGTIARRPPEPLAFLILAAHHEASLEIAHARDPRAALSVAVDALTALISGLRTRAASRARARMRR